MDVLTFETYWSVNSEIIKKWHQVGLSLFIYQEDARSNKLKTKKFKCVWHKWNSLPIVLPNTTGMRLLRCIKMKILASVFERNAETDVSSTGYTAQNLTPHTGYNCLHAVLTYELCTAPILPTGITKLCESYKTICNVKFALWRCESDADRRYAKQVFIGCALQPHSEKNRPRGFETNICV